MPEPDPQLAADLVDRVRETANRGPAVEIVVAIARGREAAELRSKQLAAIVRLLRHAVEIRRAA